MSEDVGAWGAANLKLHVVHLTVRMVTLGGAAQQSTFFLHVPDHMTTPAAVLADQLNDPACRFTPCRVEGETCLVRVDKIAYVELTGKNPEVAALREVGAIDQHVDLDLVTGERIAGTLLIEGAEHRRRVSDYLNRTSERFLLLRTELCTLYVNRSAVERVHLLDV